MSRGQFSPTVAHREDSGTLSEQRCRSPWIASLEKVSAFLARTNRTNNGPHDELHKFLHDIVRRKDCAVRGWRAWILEDPLVQVL